MTESYFSSSWPPLSECHIYGETNQVYNNYMIPRLFDCSHIVILTISSPNNRSYNGFGITDETCLKNYDMQRLIWCILLEASIARGKAKYSLHMERYRRLRSLRRGASIPTAIVVLVFLIMSDLKRLRVLRLMIGFIRFIHLPKIGRYECMFDSGYGM